MSDKCNRCLEQKSSKAKQFGWFTAILKDELRDGRGDSNIIRQSSIDHCSKLSRLSLFIVDGHKDAGPFSSLFGA
jgi:hypothetical protein